MKRHALCKILGGLMLLSLPAMAATIQTDGSSVFLSFDNPDASSYTIYRSTGRFGEALELGTTDGESYIDELTSENPYDLYYTLVNPGVDTLQLALEATLFGENMYIFRPTDQRDSVANTINRIAASMNGSGYNGQFSTHRYAFYFHEGDYKESATFNMGYYTHIGGLGAIPHTTQLQNVFTLCPLDGDNVTCSFWRSIENVRIAKTSDDNFWWAVSQAAPIRRVYSERQTLYDFGKSASGGFTADCYFELAASGWSQQQWYTRNSYLSRGTNGLGIPGWNHAYQGIEFGSASIANAHQDNWKAKGNNGSWGFLSNEGTTPIIREKPFLYYQDERYKVFVPDLRENCKGVSYTALDMGKGETLDLLDDFYIAYPGVTAAELNAQLATGKHLFFTPGIYSLEAPIHVTSAGTVVLGTGYATLRPTSENTTALMIVEDVDNVTIASLLFDAGTYTRHLLQVGTSKTNTLHEHAPTLLSDLYFRVGGATQESTQVDVALEINSNNVLGDHFWIWRADHSYGVGWTKNKSKNGLVVNGDYVTLYGLFNEHFQEYQTLWNGEFGRTYFYQCETPYDVPSMSQYMSHDGTKKGYAAYKVADDVKHHYACMMGIYDVFIRSGSGITIESSVEVPSTDGVHIHNACNYGLSGGSNKGIGFVVNDCVASSVNKQYKHFHVYDYCITGVKEMKADDAPTIQIYPNPVQDHLYVSGISGQDQVRITDLGGRVIMSVQGPHVSLQNLNAGTYLIQVQEGNHQYVFKLIKQ